MAEEKVREIQSKGLEEFLLCLKTEEPHAKERGWPLEAESSQLTARKQRPQFYNSKEENSANNLNEVGNGFFIRTSR